MKSYLSLFAVLCIASVGAEVININADVDKALENDDDYVRQLGRTAIPFQVSNVVGNVTFTSGLVIGIDSEVRTGDCTRTVEGTTSTTDLHTGYTFLGVVINDLKIDGKEMSAFVRIHNSSIQFKFTVHKDTKCHVTLDAFQFEQLDSAVLSASRPEYDGLDVSDYVRTNVRSMFNDYLKSLTPKRESELQSFCNDPQSLLSEVPKITSQMHF